MRVVTQNIYRGVKDMYSISNDKNFADRVMMESKRKEKFIEASMNVALTLRKGQNKKAS